MELERHLNVNQVYAKIEKRKNAFYREKQYRTEL